MNRTVAIRILVEQKLKKLDPDARARILQGCWTMPEVEDGYDTLPGELRERLMTSEGPERPDDPLYDPLLRLKLGISFVGVQNAYLIEEVWKLTPDRVNVTGDRERMFACRCCLYRTLERRAENEICRVCFWEDDGTVHPTSTSSSNQMTLENAQRNFELFGACREQLREFIDEDGPRKYPRIAAMDPKQRLYRLSGKRCPCCGGKGGLLLFACQKCARIVLLCDEMDVLFPDPTKLDPADGLSKHPRCPKCRSEWKYMPATPKQILRGGFSENEYK